MLLLCGMLPMIPPPVKFLRRSLSARLRHLSAYYDLPPKLLLLVLVCVGLISRDSRLRHF